MSRQADKLERAQDAVADWTNQNEQVILEALDKVGEQEEARELKARMDEWRQASRDYQTSIGEVKPVD